MQPDGILDLEGNPIHAKAYMTAAAFFLSKYPSDWNAEKLATVLVTEEHPEQIRILVWDGISKTAGKDDPFLLADEHICMLAESFIDFLNENK